MLSFRFDYSVVFFFLYFTASDYTCHTTIKSGNSFITSYIVVIAFASSPWLLRLSIGTANLEQNTTITSQNLHFQSRVSCSILCSVRSDKMRGECSFFLILVQLMTINV